jgi:UV excision repair protein RAD23
MKLTIKSLKQVPYEVEVENESNSIKDLKLVIEKVHGFDSATLKLVFNGQVLDDSKKLSDCNIKEGNVIVMMSAKAKPVNVQKEEAKTEEKVPVQTGQVQPQQNISTNISSGNQQSQVQTTTTSRPQAQPKDYSNEVKTLMEFGFPKTECEAAIKAARGNINVATEFLISGIPENLPMEEEGLGLGGNSSEVDANSPAGLLRNIASVVKVLCHNNPTQLQNILMTLQQNSPELMELIRENEEEFKNLIQQPVTEDDLRAFQDFNRQARGGESSMSGNSQGQSGQMGSGSGNRNTIRLSKEDYDAVGRLKELGFSEMDAVQAFFACDKNEDMAANFLMENRMAEQDNQVYIDCKKISVNNFFIKFLL